MSLKRKLLAAVAVLAGLLVSGQALAFPSYAATHLNIRSGPGPQYPVLGITGFNNKVDVHGCLADISWCDVTWKGVEGWAAGEYLDYDATDAVVLLTQVGGSVGIPVLTYTAVDAVAPVTPLGAIVSVMPTGVAPVAVTVPSTVHAYVSTQTVDPVYVTGEVVIGAVLPTAVPLYAIPQSPYQFTIVNGQRVLVETGTRKVVYLYQ